MTEPRTEFERRFAERFEAYLDEGLGALDPKEVAHAAIGDQPRATGRLRMATLAAGTVLAAAVVTVFVVKLLPTNLPPAATTSAEPSSRVSQSPSPQPSREATWPTAPQATATVPTQLDLADLGFWTLEQPLAAGLPTLHLRAGTLDGRVAANIDLSDPGVGPLDIPVLPRPVGPAGGRVLYVADDGHEATLHVVSTSTGVDQELVRTTGIIAGLAIDPSGSMAYYHTIDRTTGAVGGVEGIAVDGGKPHTIVTADAVQSAAGTPRGPSFPQLVVSMDGNWVVLASCHADGCDVFSAHPNGGALLLHSQILRSDDTIVGIAGDLLIGSSTCPQASCDGFALDLQTGDRWPLGGTQSPFDPRQLIAGPRGPLALGQGEDYNRGQWHVEALDLTDRTQSTVFASTFKPAFTVVRLAAKDAGAELPPGWFLIYRNADAAPNPYPDYSAATLGGTAEQPIAIMTFPRS